MELDAAVEFVNYLNTIDLKLKKKILTYLADKLDGGWSVWSAWSTCTVSCGGGTQTRSRSCSEPVPVNGGAECVGHDTESQPCSSQDCPGEKDYRGFYLDQLLRSFSC